METEGHFGVCTGNQGVGGGEVPQTSWEDPALAATAGAMAAQKKPKPTLGWREWASLPELGLDRILAKVDTGARTSSLHAFDVHEYRAGDGERRVRFAVHPRQRDESRIVWCDADLVDRRTVTDSGGHREKRFVIRTPVRIADREWPIEITLTDRATLKHRMLLGRSAVSRRFLVDPGRSHVLTPKANGATEATRKEERDV